MKLVLIEGPGKRDSVQHYLGNGYKVMPTFGHCRDLPEKTLAVDIENNFEPEYVIVPDHKRYVDDIKRERELAKTALVLGVNTAIPFDVVKVGDKYGSVFERRKS